MSTLATDLVTALASTAGVTTEVGARYFNIRAPQTTLSPYVVFSMPTSTPINHLRGHAGEEIFTVRFDIYGKNYGQLEAIRSALIGMMWNAFHSVPGFAARLFEDDTALFHLVQDFSTWHST